MQFESFQWLSHHGIWAIIPCSTSSQDRVSLRVNFWDVFSSIFFVKLWVLFTMPDRPVRDQWECPRKIERHFPIKPGQPIETAFVISNSFSELSYWAKNRFVRNGTANFDRNIPAETCGQPPEVIPNIPVRRNWNGPLHLNSERNFRNVWLFTIQLPQKIWKFRMECKWKD